jgi:hypothetical protein
MGATTAGIGSGCGQHASAGGKGTGARRSMQQGDAW